MNVESDRGAWSLGFCNEYYPPGETLHCTTLPCYPFNAYLLRVLLNRDSYPQTARSACRYGVYDTCAV